MAETDIGARFACNQCGTVEGQRQGTGRPFTRCAPCRTSRATGRGARRIAEAVVNQHHRCEGCGVSFKPKGADRTRFCSRECFFEKAGQARRARLASIPPKPERPCDVCGTALKKGKRCASCSVVHARDYARARAMRDHDATPRRCAECGQQFSPVYGDKLKRYCSRLCSKKACNRTARIRYKALKRGATVESVNSTRVFVRDGWLCHLCGGKTDKARRGTYHPKAPELDHIVPLSKGGAHSYANTACAHRKCNAAKSDTIMGQPSLLAA
jgi:5-methylcytosine-specific restriction endonuclease McrA